MQSPSGTWTRRQFMRVTAGAAAAAPMHRAFAQSDDKMEGFAYAASHENGAQGSIHVYAVLGDRWTPIETLPSDAPSFTCVSADGKTLYVANEVAEVDGLPSGSVSAYRIDAEGRLQLLGTKPLSLAAVRPKHLALSSDGKTLAVAAFGGGIYNTISIGEDGSLGRIMAIRKEAGCGPHETQTSAHPHTLLFDDRNGCLLASDYGSDRVSFFEPKRDKLIRRQALSIEAGGGPGSLALGSSALYVQHSLGGRIGVYRYDAMHGVGEKMQNVAVDTDGTQPLVLHTSGRTLYAGGRDLLSWSVNSDGRLASLKAKMGISSDTLVPAFDGRVLFAVDGDRGVIRQVNLNAQTGEPLNVREPVQAHVQWTSLSVLTV